MVRRFLQSNARRLVIGPAAFAMGIGLARSAQANDAARTPTFTEDVAAIFRKNVKRATTGFDCADVTGDLRRNAPVGTFHQTESGGTGDAAMAYRQDNRHSEVQERSVVDRPADPHDSSVGGCGCAERRSEGDAGTEAVA